MNNNNNNKRRRGRGQRANQAAAFNAVTREVQLLQQKLAGQQKRQRAQRGAQVAQQGGRNVLQAAPQAMARVRVNPRKARQRMTATGERTILFEEYVQDIISSGTDNLFSCERFRVQPGLSQLFAWLAEQAINYQEYRFRKLSFKYETDQTITAGKVMYAFSPDAADPVPLNKQEMLEYGIKGKSAVWQEFEMPVPVTEALGARRYIRSGTLAANLDIKTYDLGALFVATQGVSGNSGAGTNCGELYICYEVELITPVVQALPAAQARSITVTSGGSVAEGTPFGTTPTTLNGLDVTVDATGAYLIFGRVGYYLVEMDIVGTGLNTAYVPVPVVGTLGAADAAYGSVTVNSGISNAAANAGTAARVSFLLIVSQRKASFAPGLATQGTTVTSSVTRVSVFAGV
jgi:hypothetical protein